MKKFKKILYYLIPTALLVLGLFSILNNNIWADEVFTLTIIKYDFNTMINKLLLDVHPPLYYLIFKMFFPIVNFFIQNEIIAGKFISFIPLILLQGYGYKVIRKEFGKTEAFLFNVFMVSMPSVLLYGTEIRMYSLCYFLITASIIHAIKIIKYNKSSDWIILTVYSLISLFTHYFSGFASVVIYTLLLGYFIYKKFNLNKLLISSLINIICFLPWIYYKFLNNSSDKIIGDYWIKPLTLSNIISFIKFPFSTLKLNFLSYVLVGLTIYVFVRSVKKLSYIKLFGINVYAGLIIVGVLISVFVSPLFVLRFIVPVLGAFWLTVALLCKDRVIITIYVILGFCFSFERLYIENENSRNTSLMLDILDKIESEDIITNNGNALQVIAYFNKKENNYYVGGHNSQVDIYVETYPENFYNFKTNYDFAKGKTVYFFVNDDKFIGNYDKEFIGEFFMDNVGNIRCYKVEL